MTIIDNEQIKAVLIAKLKTLPLLTAKLSSSAEIRESQYQGTTFDYPNVRVRIVTNEPYVGCYQRVNLGVQVHSEKDASEEAEVISGIIARELNDTAFSLLGVAMSLLITNIVPAQHVDVNTWRSEVLFRAIVS